MINNPGNLKPYEKIFVILSLDGKGNEGICMLQTPFGPQVAVTGNENLLERYVSLAKAGMDEANRAKLKLVVGTFERTGTKQL